MCASTMLKPDALLLAHPEKTPLCLYMRPTPKTQGCIQERPKDQGNNLGRQSHTAGVCPSCIDDNAPDDSDESDTGPANLWNPHTSLKPSELDGDASDGEIDLDGNLPYGMTFEVNNLMMEMMISLEDAWDLDWLPAEEQKRLANRKKGD